MRQQAWQPGGQMAFSAPAAEKVDSSGSSSRQQQQRRCWRHLRVHVAVTGRSLSSCECHWSTGCLLRPPEAQGACPVCPPTPLISKLCCAPSSLCCSWTAAKFPQIQLPTANSHDAPPYCGWPTPCCVHSRLHKCCRPGTHRRCCAACWRR